MRGNLKIVPGFLSLLAIAPVGPVTGESVSGEIAYTVDALHNASGGIGIGTGVLQNLDLQTQVDLERLFGLRDGVLSAYVLWNDHNTFSDRFAGDLQVASNIDAGEGLRLFELWYEQSLSDEINLRFGLYDLNSEFDAIDTAGLFLNSSHGIGNEYSQTGRNAPSIFPVTSLALRLHWQPGKRDVLRYALLDAVPGDPRDPSATRIRLGGDEGWLHALEYNHLFAGGARVGLGGFAYSKDFETVAQPDPGNPRRDGGNTGAYLFADVPVPGRLSESAAAFLRLGVANQKLNPVKAYIGAGVVLTGVWPQRPGDKLGIAVASARTGRDFRRANGSTSHETAIELSYSMPIGDWLRLQPDIQYIVNPGTDPLLKDAFVIGIRLIAHRAL